MAVVEVGWQREASDDYRQWVVRSCPRGGSGASESSEGKLADGDGGSGGFYGVEDEVGRGGLFSLAIRGCWGVLMQTEG